MLKMQRRTGAWARPLPPDTEEGRTLSVRSRHLGSRGGPKCLERGTQWERLGHPGTQYLYSDELVPSRRNRHTIRIKSVHETRLEVDIEISSDEQ